MENSQPSPAQTAQSAQAAQFPPPPLLGREPEWQRLCGALEALSAGRAAGAHWLFGPAGIGKSRLAEELALEARQQGLAVAIARCEERPTLPYAPFRKILQALLPGLEALPDEELARQAPVLQEWLPELARPGAAAAPALEPASGAVRLQAAVVHLLAALAKARGLVLVLDDWQWADPLSEALLDHLLRSARELPLFVLVTSMPPSSMPAWGDKVTPAPLSSLSRDAVLAMLAACLGSRELAELLLEPAWAFAEGNPRKVLRLLGHWLDRGELRREGSAWVAETSRLQADLPAGALWLAQKLAGLSASARLTLRAGALLGGEFDRGLLAALSELSEDAQEAAIALLLQQQLFVTSGPQAFRLAEGSLCEALLEALSNEERIRMHAAAARELVSRLEGLAPAEAPHEAVLAIAEHALRGQEVEASVSFALEAGVRSAAMYANAAAERYLSEGLELLRHEGQAAYRWQRLAYLRALADVRRVSGHAESALPIYQEALRVAEALGETVQLGRLLTSLAKVHQGRDDLPEALYCCERSLEVSLAANDAGNAARCLMTAARIGVYQGNVSQARQQLEQALALAHTAGDKSRIAEALALKGFLQVLTPEGNLETGIDHLHESIGLLAELGDKVGLNMSYMLLGNAQSQLGDFSGAWKSFTLARWICQEIGNRTEEGIALVNLAITALELGNFGESAQLAAEGRANAQAIENNFQIVLTSSLEAAAGAFLGHLEGARAALTQALDRARDLGNKYLEALVLPHLIEVLLQEGRLAEAIAAGTTLEALVAQGNKEPESRMHALMAEALARLGDLTGAEAHAARAWSSAAEACSQGHMARALRVKALLAYHREDREGARKFALASLATSNRLQLRYQIAQLEGLLGELALATGQEEAAGRFRNMGALAEALGTPLLKAASLAGLAAAEPSAALGHAREARAVLDQLLIGWPEEDLARLFRHGAWSSVLSAFAGSSS